MRPFNVRPNRDGPGWLLWSRSSGRVLGVFESQGEAIDYAYRHWPWWP